MQGAGGAVARQDNGTRIVLDRHGLLQMGAAVTEDLSRKTNRACRTTAATVASEHDDVPLL
jgi:hypothetical protein